MFDTNMISAKEIDDAFHTFFTEFYQRIDDIKFIPRIAKILKQLKKVSKDNFFDALNWIIVDQKGCDYINNDKDQKITKSLYLFGHIVKEDEFMGRLMIAYEVDIDKYMNPQDINDGKEHVVTSLLTCKYPIFIEEAT